MRAGLMPNAVQWRRCGGLRGPNLAQCVVVRRRFRAKAGVFWQTLVTIDEHERQVHVVATERHFRDRALGLGKQRVQFAFKVFESEGVGRIVILAQSADTPGEVFERGPDILGISFVDKCMGYFDPGSYPSTVA